MSSYTVWDRPYKEECGLSGTIAWLAWFPLDDFELTFNAEDDGFPTPQADTLGFSIDKVPAAVLREVENIYGFFLQFNPEVQPQSLPRCAVGVAVTSHFTDPADLSHLQTSQAICRGLARLGAVALFDMKGWRFWGGDEMLNYSPERNFAVAEHVSVFNMQHPVVGAYCHTRGLCKFARPEVFITGLTPADDKVPEFLNELALRLALGKNYEDKVVVTLYHPSGALPPITFETFQDDSNDPEPGHGLGRDKFSNAAIRVVDFDEEESRAGNDCKFLLAALRGIGSSVGGEASSLGINFGAWGE